MITIKYCDSNSNTIAVQECHKVCQTSFLDENKNKCWVLQFYSVSLLERIDVFVPNFSKGMELLDTCYKSHCLDISSDSNCSVYITDYTSVIDELCEDCTSDDPDFDIGYDEDEDIL